MQLGIFPEFGDFIDSDHQGYGRFSREFNLEIIVIQRTKKKMGGLKDIYFYENRKINEKEVIREFNKIVPQLIKDKKPGNTYKTENAYSSWLSSVRYLSIKIQAAKQNL